MRSMPGWNLLIDFVEPRTGAGPTVRAILPRTPGDHTRPMSRRLRGSGLVSGAIKDGRDELAGYAKIRGSAEGFE